MSFSPFQASGHDEVGHANKRPRLDNAQASTTNSASQRFFRTPELVKLVLDYLSTERIDLLTLSLVSKALRIQALRTWVKHLDVSMPTVNDRIKFLKADLTLLDHVRYLRVQNSDLDQAPDSSLELRACFGENVNELLQLLIQHSTSVHNLPLIDLTILNSDTVHLPTPLAQRVVALRVSLTPNCPELVQTPEADDDTDRDSSHQDSHDSRFLRNVADIIQQAAEGPGLSVFCFEDYDSGLRPHVPIWQQLALHARTLRTLKTSFYNSHLPDQLANTAFYQLETFSLRFNTEGQVSLIESFLDGAHNLRDVDIGLDTDTREALSLRQTFPHLRTISINGFSIGVDEQRSFAGRHPSVVVLEHTGRVLMMKAMPSTSTSCSSSSSLAHDHSLGHMLAHSIDRIEQHLEAGRLFARVAVCNTGPATMQRCLTALHTHLEAAQRLTCLELGLPEEGPLDSLYPPAISMLGSDNFPHLTELLLSMPQSWPPPLGQDRHLEVGIGRLMEALIPARSLEILQVRMGKEGPLNNDILPNSEFPPLLKHFSCCDKYANEIGLHIRRSFFRFLPSHMDAFTVETTSGGQRGRLQRIPATFRTRITKKGIWHESPAVFPPMKLLLDHSGDSLTCFRL